MRTIAIAAVTLIATTATASAHSTKWIDRVQDAQAQRIEQGRYSGELTRREYWRLKSEQAKIAELEAAAKRDGVVTSREYRAIRDAQQEASRHIYQETHDGQVSWFRRMFRHSY